MLRSRLELELQTPLNCARCAEGKHARAGSDSVRPACLNCAVDRTRPAVELARESIRSGIEVREVENVKHAHARRNGKPLVECMAHPAEFQVEGFQPAIAHLPRNYRCDCRSNSAQRLQVCQSKQTRID